MTKKVTGKDLKTLIEGVLNEKKQHHALTAPTNQEKATRADTLFLWRQMVNSAKLKRRSPDDQQGEEQGLNVLRSVISCEEFFQMLRAIGGLRGT